MATQPLGEWKPQPLDNEWTDREEDPSVFLNNLMRQDNPYMEQARTTGLQQANQRGLLSSSMAVGATQDASIRAALPLAQQAATQNTQRNLANQQFEQQRVLQSAEIGSRERVALAQIESTEGLAEAQRALERELQANNLNFQEKAQLRDIASAEGMAAADRALREMMQTRDIASSERVAQRQLAAQQSIASAQIEAQQATANMQVQAQLNIASMNNNLQMELAAMNLGARENELAVATLTDNARTFEQSRATIMQNTNLNAQARQDALDAINAREQQSNQAAMSLFNVELNYGSTTPGVAPPAPSPPAQSGQNSPWGAVNTSNTGNNNPFVDP